jgi:uncharacterized protein YecT (DUF1311 family)
MLKSVSLAFAALVAAAFLASSAKTQLMRPLRVDARGDVLPESATSFDCKRAATGVEKMICHSSVLARQDGDLGEALWFLRRELNPAERAALIRSQRAWLKRRNSCGDYKCVEAAYEQRSAEIEKLWGAREKYLRRNISRVGQCESTTIEWIGPRLQVVQGEPPQGTSVRFNNAVRQVSYYREAPVLSSRVGDPVRVCLISIPQDCPPADERGRFYHVTNLRTHKHWELPDSSHECGGA